MKNAYLGLLALTAGRLSGLHQVVLVMQRLRRHAPVFFVVKGAAVHLAAAEIKVIAIPAPGMAHQLIVHVVIAFQLPRLAHPAAVMGQDLVLVIKAENRRDRRALVANGKNFGVWRKHLTEQRKVTPGEDRGCRGCAHSRNRSGKRSRDHPPPGAPGIVARSGGSPPAVFS